MLLFLSLLLLFCSFTTLMLVSAVEFCRWPQVFNTNLMALAVPSKQAFRIIIITIIITIIILIIINSSVIIVDAYLRLVM